VSEEYGVESVDIAVKSSDQSALRRPLGLGPRIVAVGGGKGGIGKSIIVANMGMILAGRGRKVVLVDADLGGANLHTCLGIEPPERTLGDFVERRVTSLENCIQTVDGVSIGLISGARDSLNAAHPKFHQKLRLLQHLRRLDADLVLLDLGAGTSFNTIDFFIHADESLAVALPEPGAIENLYRFLKTAFYRSLKRATADDDIARLIDMAMEQRPGRPIPTPADLLNEVAKTDKERSQQLLLRMQQFKPRILLNRTRNFSDVELGYAIQKACYHYFGTGFDFAGFLSDAAEVSESTKRRYSVTASHPHSQFIRQLKAICFRLFTDA